MIVLDIVLAFITARLFMNAVGQLLEYGSDKQYRIFAISGLLLTTVWLFWVIAMPITASVMAAAGTMVLSYGFYCRYREWTQQVDQDDERPDSY